MYAWYTLINSAVECIQGFGWDTWKKEAILML